MGKLYSIVRAHSGEMLEEFSTLSTAEEFLLLMKGKGEDVILKTNQDADVEENPGWDIEGLEIVQPTNDFGNELDQFNEGSTGTDDELPQVDGDDI